MMRANHEQSRLHERLDFVCQRIHLAAPSTALYQVLWAYRHANCSAMAHNQATKCQTLVAATATYIHCTVRVRYQYCSLVDGT